MHLKIDGKPEDYYKLNGIRVEINEEKMKYLFSCFQTLDDDTSKVITDFFKDSPEDVIFDINLAIEDEKYRRHREKMSTMKREYKKGQIKDKIILVLISVVVILGLSFGGYKLFSPSEPKCDTDVGAFVMSQNVVKRNLKSPSSADFPYINDDGVYVYGDMGEKDLTICKYTVYAYVDAQNSFGAKIRNRYSVDLEYNPRTDTWKSTRVLIE